MTPDLYARAMQAHSAGDLAQAELLYGEVLRAEPAHAPALANQATIWLQQGRLEEGVRGLKDSLRVDPGQPTALTNLGLALIGLGRQDQAIDAFRRAVGHDPRRADAQAH